MIHRRPRSGILVVDGQGSDAHLKASAVAAAFAAEVPVPLVGTSEPDEGRAPQTRAEARRLRQIVRGCLGTSNGVDLKRRLDL